MPLFDFQCCNAECQGEWEDLCSRNEPLPTECPFCHQQTAEKVMSLTGKGVVELVGGEILQSVKKDANRLKKEIYSSENKYANFISDSKYQTLQQKIDKSKRQLVLAIDKIEILTPSLFQHFNEVFACLPIVMSVNPMENLKSSIPLKKK